MPKKSMTEAERKAFGAKMRAAREAKMAERVAVEEEIIHPSAVEVDETDAEPTVTDLQRQILELKGMLEHAAESRYAPHTEYYTEAPTISNRGVTGTLEKYTVDPTYYPDPTARLAKEPKLARFAFDLNYGLQWDISTTAYETKDGINVKEPRFMIELNRVVMDEETGEPTDTRYVVCRMMFHEDPQAAIVIARENGLEPNDFLGGEKVFLDEMRYLRMRDWLLEAFYPPKSQQQKTTYRDAVIGGKVVQVFEINSEDPSAMPFEKIAKKTF